MTMTLLSEAAYSRTMPAFLEGMPVKGRIRPSMDQPDTIHSVVISVSEHSFHLKYNFIFYGNFLYDRCKSRGASSLALIQRNN